ncbi:hypothetical protein KZ810_10785 [Sphingomonas sp. RHCKR47]|nr:hypothetical protein [Sphingomonas citricola]MBW6523980.1 hypothetical protein [Sphingomonas citricola]
MAALVDAVRGDAGEPADGGVLARLREQYPDG